MGRTKNQIIDEVTDAYIANLDMDNLPTPEEMSNELVNLVEDEIALENDIRGKGRKFKAPETLLFDQIAQLMAKIYPIARISCAGASADDAYDLLAIYMDSGINEGTYSTSEDDIYKLAIRFNRRLSQGEFAELLLSSIYFSFPLLNYKLFKRNC